MLFHFELRDLNAIPPWTDGDGSNPHLSWFGLSLGWYWIDAGGTELFRSSSALLDKWSRDSGNEPWFLWMEGKPYLDYQVARLWEDILDLLPHALNPVPAPLTVAFPDEETLLAWELHAEQAVVGAMAKAEAQQLTWTATSWWNQRYLDTAYLSAGPDIRIWGDGAHVHIEWDARNCFIDGLPAWEAAFGTYQLPAEQFLAEVRDFDRRFLRRMHDRIAIAQGEWKRPEIALSTLLNQEQGDRSQWLQRQLDGTSVREATNWENVHQAIATIEGLPSFTGQRVGWIL